jgi:hypothetical protein
VSWLGTRIDQNAHLGVQNTPKRMEKPTVGVNLFAVLLFEAEDHLYRRKIGRLIPRRSNQLLCWCDRELSGILELLLVKADQRKERKGVITI